MGFIASMPHKREYGETASLLLQMADEMGYPVASVRTVAGGFEVPDALEAVLTGVQIAAPAVEAPAAEPPASWSQPLPQVDVMIGLDGQVVLTPAAQEALEAEVAVPDAAGREEIRAWAQENGHAPAPVGKLKQVVIEAFRAAHPDRATAE